MASYELVFRKFVAKDLRPFPRRDVRRILSRIRLLPRIPRPAGCEKLIDRELYRIRQGAYRIIYAIEDSRLIVEVIRVAHRRDAYGKT